VTIKGCKSKTEILCTYEYNPLSSVANLECLSEEWNFLSRLLFLNHDTADRPSSGQCDWHPAVFGKSAVAKWPVVNWSLNLTSHRTDQPRLLPACTNTSVCVSRGCACKSGAAQWTPADVVFGGGPSNAANWIFSRATLVAMATKFGTYWVTTRLMWEIYRRSLRQMGGG